MARGSHTHMGVICDISGKYLILDIEILANYLAFFTLKACYLCSLNRPNPTFCLTKQQPKAPVDTPAQAAHPSNQQRQAETLAHQTGLSVDS